MPRWTLTEEKMGFPRPQIGRLFDRVREVRDLVGATKNKVPGALLSAAAEATVGLVDDGVAAIWTKRRGGTPKARYVRLRPSSCCAR